jgi:peptidoglycan/LPS O-acetylase OafA/YrhL
MSHGGRVPFTGTRDPWALIPTVLLVQAFVMPSVGTWNTQSWSISVELGLYFVWACAWRAIGRFAVPLAVAQAVLLLTVWEVRPELIGNQVWAMRGFAGFGLGIGVRAIERHLSSRGRAVRFGVATGIEAAVLAGLVLVVNQATPLYLSDALFAALVLVFAFGRGWFAQVLGTAPFVFFGAISYSLYMVHGFVIGRTLDVLTLVQWWTGLRLVEHPANSMGLLVTPRWATDVLTLAIVAMAIALAWLSWRWIEEPCRRWSRGKVAA